MRFKQIVISYIILCMTISALVSYGSASANYEKSYAFQTQYGLLGQKLYISIQPTLYNHYSNQSHSISSDSDFEQFITPGAVKPIADAIQKATKDLPNNDEQFANAVLTMVHQIPYMIVGPAYPIETIVNSSGDCIGLSLLAASIMKAGGLDVVLIRYEGINPGHVNVGVSLNHTPIYHSLLFQSTSYDYDNKTYWTAEATPEMDWKVGDQSSMLANTKAIIIPINNLENPAPSYISASLGSPIQSSSLGIDISSKTLSLENDTRGITISGTAYPSILGQNVTIFITENMTIEHFYIIPTDSNGNYSFTWNFTSCGTFYIAASSSGNSTYAGADSDMLTFFIGPESFIQYQAPDFNYILKAAEKTDISYYLMGPENVISRAISPLQGVNRFLSIPVNQNVTISYNFIIVQTGHNDCNISTSSQTLPKPQESFQAFSLIDQSYLESADVPNGMNALPLPDDINNTINNQFCFQLQNSGYGNYSLDMKALNNYEISNITTQANYSTVIMNVSQSLNENTWYTVTESLEDNQVIAQVKDANGTLVKSLAAPSNFSKTIILIGDNVDNAVVMKNLDIQSNSKPVDSSMVNDKESNQSNPEFLHYAIPVVISIIVVSIILDIIRRRREA